jgi:hypothetical protein
VGGILLASLLAIYVLQPSNGGSPSSDDEPSGLLLGHIDGARFDQAMDLDNRRNKGAYSEQNRSFLTWVWDGGTVFDDVFFRIRDDRLPMQELVYRGLLVMGNNGTHLFTFLTVFGLARGPYDDETGTYGVPLVLFIDTDGRSPLTEPAAGVSANHVYGYGSGFNLLRFPGFWKLWDSPPRDWRLGAFAWNAVSDGRNTTYMFKIPLRGGPSDWGLQVPGGTTKTISFALRLEFNGPYGDMEDPFDQPASTWPNDGVNGNPDGYLSSKSFQVVTVVAD